MTSQLTRRRFLQVSAAMSAGAGLAAWPSSSAHAVAGTTKPLYRIDVAEYSLHRMLNQGTLDPLDYGPFCRDKFDVDAVEYWNGPFLDKATDTKYMDEMKKRSDDAGVKSLLIMIDSEGNLGDPDAAKRKQAVQNHHKWVDAARRMGCHSIRVNARSAGSFEEQQKLAADGLAELAKYASGANLDVIVENHGGLSSNGAWLAGVIKKVDMKNCGTLPDFGNFDDYDRYKGVEEMMPFAKAVSAKSYGFDAQGNETQIDYLRMMKIVTGAGYHGYVGIEWEGGRPGEVEGVLLTKRLLERVRDELTAAG